MSNGRIDPRSGLVKRTVSVMALLLIGCHGPQSALAPAGRGAERIAELFWWMAGGAICIWLGVVGLATYCAGTHPASQPRRAATLIIGGGAVFPTIVLAVLLIYGLAMLPDLLRPAPEGSLRIAVTGEQWWWRAVVDGYCVRPLEKVN